jgi:predicted nucleotidyltransferase
VVTQRQIDEAVRILVREAAPLGVILFGSGARGEAGPESDVDLLVISHDVQRPRAEMARLRRALSPLRMAVDVLVADAGALAISWADFPGSYRYDALREGKVLYAVDRPSAPATP